MKPIYTALLFALSLILLLTAAVAHQANQPRASSPDPPPRSKLAHPKPTLEQAPKQAQETPEEKPLMERIQGTWNLDHAIDGEQVHQLGMYRGIHATFKPGGDVTLRFPKMLGGTGQSIHASTRVLLLEDDMVRLEVTELEVAHGQAPPHLFPNKAGGMQVDVCVEDGVLVMELVGNGKSLVFKRRSV